MPKTCTKCGVEKPLSEYRERSDRGGLYRTECKSCQAALTRALRRREPEAPKCAECDAEPVYGAYCKLHWLELKQNPARAFLSPKGLACRPWVSPWVHQIWEEHRYNP